MSEKQKKPGGGPKTAEGKKIASKNSLVHGATSNVVASDDQQALVDRYVQELTSYYKPVTPLERLQIQRIALCKIKLDALYELEQVKLQIATEDLRRDPSLVMQRVQSSSQLIQDFAMSLSKRISLDLPMGLTPELLAVFVSEITAVGGKLHAEDDMTVALPRLDQHIQHIATSLGSTPYGVLIRMGVSINELLADQSANSYRLKQRLYKFLRNNEENHSSLRGEESQITITDEVDIVKINDALDAIIDLNEVVVSAAQVAEDLSRMQSLMMRSVTLSGEESDRLLRYQTTWERRLSSAIGELLALQAKNATQK